MEQRKSVSSIRENNEDLYGDYYNKSSLWFSFRYDTQIKRKTALYLIQRAGLRMKNLRVLDIGFGSGAILFSFDRSCGIFGVEISDSAIRQAKIKSAKLGYKEYGFHYTRDGELEYLDGSFDLVIASHVLEHVEDDQHMLQEIFRVLKLGGAAVFLVPINERYHDPKHVRQYTPSGFLHLLRQSGFRNVLMTIENELLFYLVEKFYFKGYNKQWHVAGPIIVALFNLPTSILPFSAHRIMDRLFMLFGLKPRQFGCVVRVE